MLDKEASPDIQVTVGASQDLVDAKFSKPTPKS